MRTERSWRYLTFQENSLSHSVTHLLSTSRLTLLLTSYHFFFQIIANVFFVFLVALLPSKITHYSRYYFLAFVWLGTDGNDREIKSWCFMKVFYPLESVWFVSQAQHPVVNLFKNYLCPNFASLAYPYFFSIFQRQHNTSKLSISVFREDHIRHEALPSAQKPSVACLQSKCPPVSFWVYRKTDTGVRDCKWINMCMCKFTKWHAHSSFSCIQFKCNLNVRGCQPIHWPLTIIIYPSIDSQGF